MWLPSRRGRTRTASRSFARCCDTAAGCAPTCSASPPTACSPWSNAHTTRNRVGSASNRRTDTAASIWSSDGSRTCVVTQLVYKRRRAAGDGAGPATGAGSPPASRCDRLTDQSGDGVDARGHDHDAEDVRQERMDEHGVSDAAIAQRGVGYLVGHADGEGQVREVAVVGWLRRSLLPEA